MATKKKKTTEQNIKSAVSSGMQGISNDEDRARQFADQVARAVVSSVTGRKANTLDAGSARGGVFDNAVKAHTLGESSGRMVDRTDDYVRTDFSGASTDYRKLNKKNAKYQGLYDLVRQARQQTSENRRNRFMSGMEEMNRRRQTEAMQSAFDRLMTDNTEARNNPIMQSGQALNRPTSAAAPISDKDRYEQNKQRIDQLTEELNDYHPFYDVQGQNTGMYVQRSTGKQVSPVEFKRLQSELEGLQAENRIYERTQGVIDKYAPYQAASDFAEKSVSRTGPNMQAVDKLGVYLQAMNSNNGEQIGLAMNQINAPGTVSAGNRISAYNNVLQEGEMNNWRFLEDGEIQTYYYLMNTQGQQAADKYLNDMSAILGQRWVEQQQEDYESQSTLGKVLYNAATFGTNFTAGIAATMDTIKEAATGQEMNPYSYGRRNLNFTQAIRSQTAQDIDTATGGAGIGNFTFGDMYQALMSSVDSYIGASGMGRGFTSVMGLGAAQSKAQDLYNKGASTGQIIAGSILSGVAEAAFEYISLDKFLNTTDTRTMGQLVKQIFQQAGVEASEEMATEVANTFIDVLNRRTQSDWEQRVQSGGIKSAFLETLSEVIDAGAGGFISGGAMGGAGSIGNYAAYNAEMANLGSQSIRNGAYDVALNYARNQDNNISDRTRQLMEWSQDEYRSLSDIGKFVEAVNENIDETQTKAAIRESLEQAGRNADEAVVNAVYDQMTNNADIVTGRGTESVSDVDIAGVEQAAQEKAEQERSKAVAQYDSTVRAENAQSAVDEAVKSVSDTGHTTLKNEAGESEDVDIARVEDIGKDGMMLKLKDGRTVNSNDIAYGTEQEAILYESARNLGMTADIANNVINAYDAKMSTPIQFMYGMNEAINYGKLGVNQDVINSRGYYADLTPAQQRIGLNIGQSIAEADVKAAQEKMLKSTMRTVAKDNGHIHFMTGTEFKDMTEIQKESIGAVARTVQNITHNEVYLYETVVGKDGQRHLVEDIKPGVKGMRKGDVVTANGFYDGGTGNIYLDINAGNNGEGTILWTFSHEMTHWAKDLNRKAYNDLVSFLSTSYMEKGVDINALARAKQAKLGLSFDAAMDEVIADSMERMFTDTNLEEKLYQLMNKNRTLFEKMRDAILRLFHRIQSLYSKVDPQTTEGELVHQMGDKLEKMSDLFASLLAGAGEVNTVFDMYNGNVIEDGGYVAERTEIINGQTVTLDANTSTEGMRVEMMTDGAVSPDGQKLFQYRAMENDIPQYRELLMKHGTTAEECDLLFGMVERVMDKIKNNLEILDYAWEQDIDDRSFNPVKANSDKLYVKSVDFSTLCRKRLLQQMVQMQLQTALDRALTREEGIAIRNELMKIQQQGREIEVACALCYVESARMKSPAQIQKFLDNRETVLRDYFAEKDKANTKQKKEDAELKERQKLSKEYADDIAAGKMRDPMAYTTTAKGKKTYTPLRQLPKKLADQIRDVKKSVNATYQYTADEQRMIDALDTLTVSDFTTPDGLAALVKNYPRIYDAYVSYVRNATQSKGIEGDVWWRFGDSFQISDSLIDAMNTENGLRSQSWSDFQVIHTLDYIAAIIELSARKAKMQVYSKVPDYIKLMGLTGQMINMSLIPTTVFKGILEYDGVEGMPFKRALELRNKYHATAGTICIGISYDHIRMLLDSADIDYVIPYHHSGMSKLVRHAMKIPTWDSFQDVQNPKKLTGKQARDNAQRFGVSLMSESHPSWHTEPKFSEWIHPADIRQTANTYNALSDSELTAEEKALKKKYGKMFGTFIAMRQAADNYKKMCARRGLAPQFSYGKGDFSNEDGYWKLLIDRKMIDNVTGEFIEQQAVKPIFNESDIMEILNDEIARYAGVKADQEYATRTVVEKFLSGNMNDEINAIQKVTGVAQTAIDDVTKTSILSTAEDTTFKDKKIKKSERNQQYLSAVESGDMETAQRMVDDEAKAKGYVLSTYHGTGESFTVFNMGREGIHLGNEDIATQVAKNRFDMRSKRTRYKWSDIRNNISKMDSDAKNDLLVEMDKMQYVVDGVDYFKGDPNNADDIIAYGDQIADALGADPSYMTRTFDRKTGVNVMKLYAKMSNPFVINGDILDWNPSNIADVLFARDQGRNQIMIHGEKDISGSDIKLSDEQKNTLASVSTGSIKGDKAWNALKDILGAAGYDGIQYKNEYEGDKNSPSYIALNPSDVKSADPVTYDSNGNIISLSERFNRENNDIRFSQRDSDNRILSPAQREYFQDSKVRDKDGNLLVLYHGTGSGGFTRFGNGLIWLTSVYESARAYGGAENGQVFAPNRSTDLSEKTRTAPTDRVVIEVGNDDEFIFESEQDLRDFEKKIGGSVKDYLDKYTYQELYDEAEWNDASEEELQKLDDRRDMSKRLEREYRDYYRKHVVRTSIGDMLQNPDAYAKSDWMTAGQAWDKEMSSEGEPYTSQDIIDLLVEDYEYNKESEEQTLYDYWKDIYAYVHMPTGTTTTASDATNLNTVYKLYANLTHPYVVDNAGLRLNENGSIYYQSVDYAKANKDKYDGVIINNVEVGPVDSGVGTAVVAFSPEQVKSVTNRNPSSDPDIRFSERNPEAVETLREANRALQRQVETLKGDIHNLIELLGVQAKTKNRGVISDSSLKAVAKKILSDNGVTARNQTDFLRALENVYDTMRTAKNISYEDIREVAQPAVDWIMKHLPGSGQLSEEAQQLFSYLKGKRFYVSPAVKAELASAYGDYNTFRKSLMGRVTLTTTDTNATSLDSVWGELSSQFPWLFQADTPDVDQWQVLYDTIQQMKNSGAEEEQAYFGNLMANDILSQIYNGYWDVSTLYNDDAKYKKEINELKYKHQQQIAKLKQYYNEKIADLRGKLKKEMQESMTAYRQRVSEREQKLRKDFRDRQQAQREGRESTDFRRKIRRIADELKGRLLNPTERRYVPAALVNGVIDIANEIDTTWFDQNTTSARKFRSGLEALSRLRDAYEELRTSQNYDWSSEYSEEFSEKIKWLAKAVGDTPVRSMTHDQLSDVYDIMRDLQVMVQFATKQISETENITNYNAGMEVLAEMEEINKLGLNKSQISAFFRNYLTNPLRAVNEMTGYNPDSRLGKLITGINEGIRKGDYWAMNTRKSVEQLRDENVKAFNDATEKAYDFGLTDINGEPLKISKMQAMQLVMTWEREQANEARQHLQANGTVIADVDLLRKGLTAEARDKGQKIGPVTQQMIDTIRSKLSDWDVRFMQAARKVFDQSTQAINDTTMQTKGRILATEKNYIPYEVNKDFVRTESENVKFDATIEGQGMLKAVKAYAPQPLLIRGLNAIVDKHINDVSKVYGLMVPVRNFNKVWNVIQTQKDGGRSVKDAVRSTWGQAGMDLIDKAVADVQSPRRTQTSKIVQKIKSGFVTSTLASNISVWMKQAASYPTAGSILSGSALMKGLGRYAARKSAEVWDEIDKYTAQHYKRRQGLSSQELGDFNQSHGWTRRLSDKLGKLSPMNWIQAMDVATTAALWEATKAEVEKRGIKKDTDQYWQEVTKLYDEVIEKTQPMYDPLHRAEVTKNPALGTIIMFQTQPIQNSGILREATMEYKYAKKQYGAKSNQAKAAARNFRKAVLSQMASHMTFTAMTILANALMHKMNPYRDKETGKVTAESVLTQFLSMFGQNYFNAVVPVIGSYAISAMDKISGASRYDVFSDAVVDKLNTTMDALNKMFTQPTMENLLNAGADIAGYFGVPAKNAMNIINGARLHIMDAIKGELGSFEAGFEPTQSQEAYRIYNALEEGDTEEAERLANAYEEAHPNSTKWTTRITGMIEDKLAAGEIDQTEAERLLAEYVGMDDKDIDKWRYKQENGTTTGYSMYNDFYEAVSTGKNLKSVIKDYTDSGVKTSTLSSQITKEFKPQYVAASNAERSRMKGYLLNAYVALGYDRDKKSKDIDKWLDN